MLGRGICDICPLRFTSSVTAGWPLGYQHGSPADFFHILVQESFTRENLCPFIQIFQLCFHLAFLLTSELTLDCSTAMTHQSKAQTRKHSYRMGTTRISSSEGVYPPFGCRSPLDAEPSWMKIPLDAEPSWMQTSPGCRHPWIQIPLDADPPGCRPLLDADPSWMQIPLDAEPPGCWTLLNADPSWMQTLLDADPPGCRTLLDADPSLMQTWVQTLLDADPLEGDSSTC